MTLNTDEAIIAQVYDIDKDESIKKGNLVINIGPEVKIESIEKVEKKNTFICCNCKNKVRFYNRTGQLMIQTNNIF